MTYLTVKALHIIFITTWFAGLFYIIRLFIYYKEADDKPEAERAVLQKQYVLMSKRLWYIITWPSAILATFFAVWMLLIPPGNVYLTQSWMLIKLGFVAALYAYHWSCQVMFNRMQKGALKVSSYKLRIWNEVATIILIACVFLVVLKTALGWIWGVIGIVGVSILLMLGIKLYKNIRKKRSWDKG